MGQLKLRDYQQKVVEDIYTNNRHGINRNLVVAGTGTGKTIILTQLALDAIKQRKKILIIAHRTKLVSQISETINKFSQFKVGEIVAGKKVNYEHHFVFVGMAQTLRTRQLPPRHRYYCIRRVPSYELFIRI